MKTRAKKVDGGWVLNGSKAFVSNVDISDWVIVMAEGRVIAEGTPDDISSNQDVIDAYLGTHQGRSPLEDEV